MSDTIYKIIPQDPFYDAGVQLIQASAQRLAQFLSDAPVNWLRYDAPVFIDCGSNLDSISCPHCGAGLPFGDWQQWMDARFDGSGFGELSVTMPCCGKVSSLNALRYSWPCGFARFALEILNPVHPPPQQALLAAAGVLPDFCGYRVIIAHY